MKQIVFTLLCLHLAFSPASAEGNDYILDDSKKGVYRIYDFDSDRTNVTPPGGYKVFHISHYGRHGSRYLYSEADYDSLYVVLNREKLTEYGKKVRTEFTRLYPQFKGRASDLTELGKQQHRRLARRMCEDFPELFRKGSEIHAVTSDKTRCFMSMYNFLDELRLYRSDLQICADYSTPMLAVLRTHGKSAFRMDEFIRENYDPRPLFERLFACPQTAMDRTDAHYFGQKMYYYVSHLDGAQINDGFWDTVLTEKEVEELFKVENEKFSYNRGALCPENVTLARKTLDYLVRTADEDIASGRSLVRLRFGHDTVIMNLMTLLGLPPFDRLRFLSSDVAMGSNVRFVFARNKGGNVLVKVQYNESDVTEWQQWADFKSYCAERINWDPKQHNLFEMNSEYNPMFIAHRGLQSMGPENSFPSFKAAAEKGMWAIETDFRMTADGEVICMHDKTLDRTTDGTGLVCEKTLKEIKTLKLKPVNTKTVKQLYDYSQIPDSEKSVPTMDEYFQICRQAGAVAFIELKEDKGIIESMMAAIRKYELNGSCVISSGNLGLLERYREAGGKETIHLIFAKPEQIATLKALGNASVSFKYSDLTADIDLTIDGVHIDSFRQLVDYMHSVGIRICFRAADSREDALRHIGLGVDYMPTNVTYSLN